MSDDLGPREKEAMDKIRRVRCMGRDQLEGAFLQSEALLVTTGDELAALRSDRDRIKAQRDRLLDIVKRAVWRGVEAKGNIEELIDEIEANP